MDLFVHELAFQWGGAERVFKHLADLDPAAPVAVLAGSADVLKRNFPDRSALRFYPMIQSNRQARMAAPLIASGLRRKRLPYERLTLSSYAMTRLLPSAGPRLIYCHSPMRQIWHGRALYERQRTLEAVALRVFGGRLRAQDLAATRAADVVLAPSRRIAELVRQTYGQSVSAVVPPAVDDPLFEHPLGERGDYHVWCGRVVEPIKRLALLLQAFSATPSRRLVIVGDGRDRARLERSAPGNVHFAGWRTGDALRDLVAGARALVLPSMEDFGMVAAEALALGVPTIVTEEAGVADWVCNGQNGLVVAPTLAAFSSALRLPRDGFAGAEEVRRSAEVFRVRRFSSSITEGAHALGWL